MHRVFGKLIGLKRREVDSLERLYRRRVPREWVVTHELATEIALRTTELNRRLGLLIDRAGHVEHVVLGDARKLVLPDLSVKRRAEERFRGLRLVMTQRGASDFDGAALTDLVRLRLDMAVQVDVGAGGEPAWVRRAHLLPENPERKKYLVLPPIRPTALDRTFLDEIEALEREFEKTASPLLENVKQRRAILVATQDGSEHPFAELSDLTRSFGAMVVGQVKRRRDEEDPHTLVRRGRVEEISMCALTTKAELLIVDRDLSPGQARNLEDLTGLTVLDRTQLILAIFAQRARSGDGKLQVELARLRYQLPRLGQNDGRLSRIGGGTARGGTGSTKGVGETKVERDRRALKRRIALLTERVSELDERRKEGRKQRRRHELPVISFVGYTNAGKSTLFNLLTQAGVLAENRLFSTLDPTARRIQLPNGRPVILTDTVGFIRDLPEDLVAAFRATLEELHDASLLLHVADASDPEVFEHLGQVEGLLQALGLHDIPRVLLFNKADRVVRDEFRPLAVSKGGHLISARDGHDRDRVLDLIARYVQVLCA